VSVVLFIQHAKRMRPVVCSFTASLAAPYFHKRHEFPKRKKERKKEKKVSY
jgi:hypothetical protein